MTILLECQTPNFNHRWMLRPGQSARVGHSSWAEFSVADDQSLSDIHFSIDYLEHVVVTALGDAQIDIDGKPTTQANAIAGSTIHAGKSTFRILQSMPTVKKAIHSNTPEMKEIDALPIWGKRSEQIEWAGLSEEGKACIEVATDPSVAVAMLEAHGLLEDAIRLIASSLNNAIRIHWCVQALRSAKLAIDSAANEAVDRWLAHQNDEARLGVEAMVPWNDKSSPWTWCMTAIVWTGGSLAPLDSPTLAPPPRMGVAAVIAAIQLASCHTNPKNFRIRCIEEGIIRLHDRQTE
jgi:hypothetical protein